MKNNYLLTQNQSKKIRKETKYFNEDVGQETMLAVQDVVIFFKGIL